MKKNPFSSLQHWLKDILHTIKKDIKTDHLPGDKRFYKEHFGSRPQKSLSNDEIFAIYERELLRGDEDLIEWAVNRWVFKHGDLYRYFAEKLASINPNFQQIDAISDEDAEKILEGSSPFGPVQTYLFARLNGVVFSEVVFERLHQAALVESSAKKEEAEQKGSQESLEQLIERQRRELSRLQEKYEDKLAGIQRKYTTDVEALKKQVRSLQQQLSRNA